MKQCPKCGTEHNKPGKFCSRVCANSRVFSEELKKAISAKLTGRPGHNKNKGRQLVDRIQKNCPECSSTFFTTLIADGKYCSSNCGKKNIGGYRQGSGRSKSGYYKGIYCGSTYELCWVIYSLDHGIKFTRFSGFLENNGTKYYPDFLLDDGKTIIETKGYENQVLVDKKTAVAISHGYTVNVLRKDDLTHAFEYVKEKYSTTEYHTLYDGYKPKYNYTCSCCAVEFSRDSKKKTDKCYCSRSCSLKGNRLVSGHNQYTHREAAGVAPSPSN